MRNLALLLALVIAGASPARAETADDKSLAVGLGLSLGGTAAGVALVAGSFHDGISEDNRERMVVAGVVAALVMPAAGHWYAGGDGWRTGTTIRVVGAGLVSLAIVTDVANTLNGHHGGDYSSGIYIGLGLAALGAYLDIASTPAAIDRANRRAHRRPRTTLAPMSMHGGGGLVLGGGF